MDSGFIVTLMTLTAVLTAVKSAHLQTAINSDGQIKVDNSKAHLPNPKVRAYLISLAHDLRSASHNDNGRHHELSASRDDSSGESSEEMTARLTTMGPRGDAIKGHKEAVTSDHTQTKAGYQEHANVEEDNSKLHQTNVKASSSTPITTTPVITSITTGKAATTQRAAATVTTLTNTMAAATTATSSNTPSNTTSKASKSTTTTSTTPSSATSKASTNSKPQMTSSTLKPAQTVIDQMNVGSNGLRNQGQNNGNNNAGQDNGNDNMGSNNGNFNEGNRNGNRNRGSGNGNNNGR